MGIGSFDYDVHEECAKESWNLKCELHKVCAERDAYREALEFYADRNNWDDRWYDGGGDGRDGDVYDVISQEDVEIKEDEEGAYLSHGGEKARAALAKFENNPSQIVKPEEK